MVTLIREPAFPPPALMIEASDIARLPEPWPPAPPAGPPPPTGPRSHARSSGLNPELRDRLNSVERSLGSIEGKLDHSLTSMTHKLEILLDKSSELSSEVELAIGRVVTPTPPRVGIAPHDTPPLQAQMQTGMRAAQAQGQAHQLQVQTESRAPLPLLAKSSPLAPAKKWSNKVVQLTLAQRLYRMSEEANQTELVEDVEVVQQMPASPLSEVQHVPTETTLVEVQQASSIIRMTRSMPADTASPPHSPLQAFEDSKLQMKRARSVYKPEGNRWQASGDMPQRWNSRRAGSKANLVDPEANRRRAPLEALPPVPGGVEEDLCCTYPVDHYDSDRPSDDRVTRSSASNHAWLENEAGPNSWSGPESSQLQNDTVDWRTESNRDVGGRYLCCVPSCLRTWWTTRVQRFQAGEQTRRDAPDGCRTSEIVRSWSFEVFTSAVVVANAAFIGYSSSVNFAQNALNEEAPVWLSTVDLFFSIFFSVELLFRLCCERLYFFIGREWRWNLLDSSLVASSVLDIVLNGQGTGSALLVGRILRLARFFRLMRVTRVMRNMTSLRLVVLAIKDSIMSLFWCFAIIAFIIYASSVMMLYGASEHFREVGFDASDDASEKLKRWYGGLYPTMVSLFMAISGGADWHELMEPLTMMHEAWGPMFVLYIFFMYFGILNVVAGAFVATTSEITARDREALVKREITLIENYTTRTKDFFKEADRDRSGTLSWCEFKNHLQQKEVKAYFQALELDVGQAHMLFQLLDLDGSDEVTIDEFLDGCMRLKGQARSIDVNMLLFNHRKLCHELEKFMQWTREQFEMISATLDGEG